ncbi:hypothetical protein AZE42_13205 [Rhizopogon vesiculosus]|uniref:Uncharacterized protein n=1 Tax=Rhizopogon vesiculosus TaxID=180088 RepID=A0A1J8QAN9_9AGAM|nr:hypothetical protein AZE42_13205 [Rhizopogon vesiculosus]
MLDLAELRLHFRDESSSNEIKAEITPETRDSDLDGDENSLISIAAAIGQQSELDDVDDAMAFTSAFEQITSQQLFSFSDDRYIDKIDREDRHEIT